MPQHVLPTMLAASALWLGCGADGASARGPLPSNRPATAPTVEVVDAPASAHVVASLDERVDPCTDFYAWACGGWSDALDPLTGPTARETLVASALERQRDERLVALLEALAAAPPNDEPDLALAGRAWAACVDTDAIDDRGAAPVSPWLARAGDLRTVDDLLALSGELDRIGATVLFGSWVVPDPADPTRAVLHITLDGFNLPAPMLYWGRGEQADALRDALTAQVASLFELAGAAPDVAATDAERTVALERRLTGTIVRAESMNASPIELAVLETQTSLPWSAWFAGLGITLTPDTVVVAPPVDVLDELAEVLADTDVDALRAWARARVLVALAPHLSAPFRAAQEQMSGRLFGLPTGTPRALICARLVDWALEPAVSRAWRAAYPHDEAAQRATAVAAGVRDVLAERAAHAHWLDVASRAVVLGQLEDVVFDIGVGAVERDYGALEVAGDAGWFELYAAVLEHEASVYLDLVVDGVEPSARGALWSSAAPTSTRIEWQPGAARLEVGAGALVAPLFDASMPAAAQFGGFGALVGRSMASVVDPAALPGAADGVVDGFEAQAACFEVRLGRHLDDEGRALDGRQLRASAMADAAALEVALDAYGRWRASVQEVETVASLGDDQLFFAAFAQLWCTQQSSSLARYRAEQLGEPPPRVRVNTTLGDVEAFHEAFGCGPDAAMRNPLACEPW